MRPFSGNTKAKLMHTAASVNKHISASESVQKPESTKQILIDLGIVEDNHNKLSHTATLIATRQELQDFPTNEPAEIISVSVIFYVFCSIPDGFSQLFLH